MIFTWRRKWQPIPVPLPGKSHGRTGLVGYSLWGLKEFYTTEHLHFHFSLSFMDYSLPGSSDMGFSRQEYWSGLPCLTPGDLPHPGIVTPLSVTSKLYWQASSLLLAPPGKPGLCLDLGKVPEPFWAYFSLWENGCHDTCSLVTSRHCKEAPNHRRVCTSKCILSGYVVMSDFNCYNS